MGRPRKNIKASDHSTKAGNVYNASVKMAAAAAATVAAPKPSSLIQQELNECSSLSHLAIPNRFHPAIRPPKLLPATTYPKLAPKPPEPKFFLPSSNRSTLSKFLPDSNRSTFSRSLLDSNIPTFSSSLPSSSALSSIIRPSCMLRILSSPSPSLSPPTSSSSSSSSLNSIRILPKPSTNTCKITSSPLVLERKRALPISELLSSEVSESLNLNHHLSSLPLHGSKSHKAELQNKKPRLPSLYETLNQTLFPETASDNLLKPLLPNFSKTLAVTNSSQPSMFDSSFKLTGGFSQRVSHKLAERRRRSEMKKLFESLKSILPSPYLHRRYSKWDILNQAVGSIDKLVETECVLLEQRDSLIKKLKELKRNQQSL